MSGITTLATSDTLTASRAVINTNFANQANCHKGPSAPVTGLAAGFLWLDDDTPSATVWTLKQYDGTDWIEIYRLDTTNNLIILPSGITFVAGLTVAGNLVMGSNKITGLANGTASTDGINKGQVDGRILTAVVDVPGISASVNVPMLSATSASFVISDVKIISDTATTGSDGSNNYTFQVANVTAGNNLRSSAKSTNGADITANTVYALALDQNLTLAANDVLRLVVTKTGSPTSLSSAQVKVLVHYKVTT